MSERPQGDAGYLGCAHDKGGGEAGTWCWPCVADLLAQAEREREGLQHTLHLCNQALDEARAEVERLKDDVLGNEGAYRLAAQENGELRADLARVRAALSVSLAAWEQEIGLIQEPDWVVQARAALEIRRSVWTYREERLRGVDWPGYG